MLDVHLRIEEAGRSLNNNGSTIMSLELVQVTRRGGDHSSELETDILGLHIQRKRVRERLGLACLDGLVVLHGRQVAQDALVGRGAGGKFLGGGEDTSQEGDLDGGILLVGDLDEGLCGTSVDEADTEDVSVGEGRLEVGLELRLGFGVGIFGLGYVSLNEFKRLSVRCSADVCNLATVHLRCEQERGLQLET